MCVVNWELVLKYIEVLTTWQIMAFALVVIFIFKYKQSITKVIDRINSVKVGNVELGTNQNQDLENLDIDKAIYSKREVEELKEIKAAASGVLQESNELYVKYQWERATNLIFGTQIKLLEYLISKGEEGASFVELSKYYFEHQTLANFTESSIDKYFNFLKYFLFIEDSAINSPSQNLRITPMGIRYMDYLLANYPNIKSLRNY